MKREKRRRIFSQLGWAMARYHSGGAKDKGRGSPEKLDIEASTQRSNLRLKETTLRLRKMALNDPPRTMMALGKDLHSHCCLGGVLPDPILLVWRESFGLLGHTN
ncbi:hypothetical protein AHAS_Ahas18G0041200 [Arachis hypogaea]